MCIIHLKNSNNSINIKKLKIFREVQTYLHNKRKTQLQCVSLKKTLGLEKLKYGVHGDGSPSFLNEKKDNL